MVELAKVAVGAAVDVRWVGGLGYYARVIPTLLHTGNVGLSRRRVSHAVRPIEEAVFADPREQSMRFCLIWRS